MEMEHSGGQVTITCSPFHSKPYYPDTTFSGFSTKLQKSLQLENYEVALSSVYFPPFAKHRKMIYFKLFVALMSEDGVYFENMVVETFKYDVNNYLSVTRLVNQINEDLTVHPRTWIQGNVRMEQDVQNGLYRFIIKDKPRLRFALFLQNEFAAVFGDTKRDHEEWISFEPRTLSDEKGGKQFSYNTNEVFTKKGQGPKEATFTYMIKGRRKASLNLFDMSYAGLLYCDVVEKNAIGDTEAGFLAFVPLTDADLKNGFYEPKNLIFHNLTKFPFGSIRFDLMDVNGQRHDIDAPEFAQGGADERKDDFALTLLLRPKVGNSI